MPVNIMTLEIYLEFILRKKYSYVTPLKKYNVAIYSLNWNASKDF